MKEENKPLILTLILLVLLIGIGIWYEYTRDKCPSIDGETSNWAYCKHMGYERMINYSFDEYGNKQHELICIFDDNTTCPTWDFYYGDCGQDNVRDIPDRKLCEDVYTFEKCEEGLVPSESKYVLEQPHCR